MKISVNQKLIDEGYVNKNKHPEKERYIYNYTQFNSNYHTNYTHNGWVTDYASMRSTGTYTGTDSDFIDQYITCWQLSNNYYTDLAARMWDNPVATNFTPYFNGNTAYVMVSGNMSATYNGYNYDYSTTTSPQFCTYDYSDPLHPVRKDCFSGWSSWGLKPAIGGGYGNGATASDVQFRGNYAYLLLNDATTTSLYYCAWGTCGYQPTSIPAVVVFDISNPSDISVKSVTLVGTIYTSIGITFSGVHMYLFYSKLFILSRSIFTPSDEISRVCLCGL